MNNRRNESRDATSSAQRQAAQTLAIQALAFLAAEPERIGRFLALTGIGPDEVREAAQEPHFLAGVLEHVSGDERLLLAFAADADASSAYKAARGQSFKRQADKLVELLAVAPIRAATAGSNAKRAD